MVFGGASVVSRIMVQELHRAGCVVVDGINFKDLQKDPKLGSVALVIVLVDIPPSWPLDVVHWFTTHRPAIKVLLVWAGHWKGRDSVAELNGLPQLIMPIKTEELVATALELVNGHPDRGK
jgi:hypothetical protein